MILQTRRFWLALIGLAIIVVIIVAAAQFLIPGQLLQETEFNGAQIYFSADRRMVFAVGDCVTLTWQVQNIGEIYIDGNPAIGNGNVKSCPTPNTSPNLRLVFQDGSTSTFTLPIQFFIEQPSALFLMLLIIGLVLAAGCIFLIPRQNALSAPMNEQTLQVNSDSRRWRWLGIVTFLVLGVLVGGEFMLRAVLGTFGTTEQKVSYLYSEVEVAALPRLMAALPYLGYTMSPDYPGHNQLGFRGAEVDLPKPEGVVRVVAMGSSTTYGLTAPDDHYPAWLERTLRDKYGYTQVEVINAGVYGYNSWQTFMNFAFRIAELAPDLVIVYQVETDISPRQVYPNCYHGNNALLGVDPRGFIFTDRNPGTFGSSALYRFLTINLGFGEDAADYLRDLPLNRAKVACEQDATSQSENVAANPPYYFERNLRNLIAVARMQGIPIMFSTWAYFEDSPEPEAYWRAAIAEHNQIVRRLAVQYDVPWIDYAALAPQEADYWADYIHANGKGSRFQAERFAAFIVEQNLLMKLAKME